jgi:hypothetical protein
MYDICGHEGIDLQKQSEASAADAHFSMYKKGF